MSREKPWQKNHHPLMSQCESSSPHEPMRFHFFTWTSPNTIASVSLRTTSSPVALPARANPWVSYQAIEKNHLKNQVPFRLSWIPSFGGGKSETSPAASRMFLVTYFSKTLRSALQNWVSGSVTVTCGSTSNDLKIQIENWTKKDPN